MLRDQESFEPTDTFWRLVPYPFERTLRKRAYGRNNQPLPPRTSRAWDHHAFRLPPAGEELIPSIRLLLLE